MPTKCQIHNCTKPSVSKGLCDTHRKRVARHGTIEQTRPADWGTKEKHPAYTAWCNLRRYHLDNIPQDWKNDFWSFANSVPPKPEARCQIQRVDPTQPWGTDNFYWKEPQVSELVRSDRAAYMREWSRKAREANPDYHKNIFLKRHYGISIDRYNEMLVEQDGCCAICKKAEHNEIKGKIISLAVDHDHSTGAVRALLCGDCNRALGLFRDDPALLDAAKTYLHKHLDA
jgi:hypothetical protein